MNTLSNQKIVICITRRSDGTISYQSDSLLRYPTRNPVRGVRVRSDDRISRTVSPPLRVPCQYYQFRMLWRLENLTRISLYRGKAVNVGNAVNTKSNVTRLNDGNRYSHEYPAYAVNAEIALITVHAVFPTCEIPPLKLVNTTE